jgi:CheY-like chemotaxis protein
LLKQVGYDVLIASDPPTALAITDKVNVDLVVLDYSFPGHISGEELAQRLRATKPNLPLIMLSGYPDLPESAGQSVDVLILKGAGGPSDLLDAIARLLPDGNTERHPTLRGKERSQELLQESEELMRQLRNARASRGKAS